MATAKNLQSAQLVLPLAHPGATLETVGGKGASLARLVAAGLAVPDGFHVTTASFRRFLSENGLQPRIQAALEGIDPGRPDTLETASASIRSLFEAAQMPPDVVAAITTAYGELAGRDSVVAVRSSATAEDLPGASFAGQHETFLNVEGTGEVLAAVKRCWASLWTTQAIGYRARQATHLEDLGLGVVVQALVPAEAAGILFTAHPITGNRDQAMISTSWGLGEAVVGGLVTPDNLVVDKATGEVLERYTADKTVMTVRVNGGTQEQPVPEDLRHAPALADETAAELVRLGVEVERLFGLPVDVEWTLADGKLAIVQARPITVLHEGELEPPAEWPLPHPKGPYTRGSITDLMPDPLTPLFATLGLPALNAAYGRTLTETMGRSTSLVENIYTTINGYVYMHVTLGCRDWLWILVTMGPAIPRLLRNGERHWQQVARPRYAGVVARWRDKVPQDLQARVLLAAASELTDAMASYLTALQVDALGTAAGTEGLFTAVYNRLVKLEGRPPAATLLLGADSLPIQSEKALYQLAQWCSERPALADHILATPSERLVAQLAGGGPRPGAETLPADDWREWQSRFRAHLVQFGHSIYNLDFAKPLPADDPLPILEVLKLFMRGEGMNPHERQRAFAERREVAVQAAGARLRGLKRAIFRLTLRWAQTFAVIREDSIFDIGLGYPTVRRMLSELGRRLAAAGTIAADGDIYWLERAEVERAAAAMDRGEEPGDLSGRVAERKRIWRAEKRATPPQQLPPKARIMGIKTDAFLAASADEQTGDVIKGVAASPGQVKGTARVLIGPEDFRQMQPGEVLVAESTTPAWTPLFAMAAAVVTDIGGPLSHGSIVAREYGIPAVLGTGVATQRIRSGQVVTVDGSAGTVSLD